jgi:serine/threonine-protein kinase
MQQIRPGDLLDDYRVDALHATSAMASVYRATDLRTGNPVALKTPCTGGGAALLARLRREAKVGREIDHPGVVSFLAERRSDPEYVAMEWVEGESIREVLLREGSLPVRRAIGIAVLICDALYCIHSLG